MIPDRLASSKVVHTMITKLRTALQGTVMDSSVVLFGENFDNWKIVNCLRVEVMFVMYKHLEFPDVVLNSSYFR